MDTFERCSEKADVNVSSPLYGTPLLVASLKEHIKVVKLLLDNGADINQSFLRPEDVYLTSHRAQLCGQLFYKDSMMLCSHYWKTEQRVRFCAYVRLARRSLGRGPASHRQRAGHQRAR